MLPGIVAVMCEGEGARPESVVHPQHGQTGPDAVAGLHRDNTGNLARAVRLHQPARSRHKLEHPVYVKLRISAYKAPAGWTSTAR